MHPGIFLIVRCCPVASTPPPCKIIHMNDDDLIERLLRKSKLRRTPVRTGVLDVLARASRRWALSKCWRNFRRTRMP